MDIESNGHLSLTAESEIMSLLVVGHLRKYWRSLVGYPGKPVRWTERQEMTRKILSVKPHTQQSKRYARTRAPTRTHTLNKSAQKCMSYVTMYKPISV